MRAEFPLLVGVLSGTVLTWVVFEALYAPPARPTALRTGFDPRPRCRRLYVDFGSNIGVQTRKLFEQGKFPGSLVNPLFEAHFPALEETCAFMFEPNPTHANHLSALEECYAAKGWSAEFFPHAVSDRAGTERFNMDGGTPGKAMAARLSPDARVDAAGFYAEVTVVDAADVVRRLVQEHRPDFVMLKMDIEGAEYRVLRRLIETGEVCSVDLGVIEWHYVDRASGHVDPSWHDKSWFDRYEEDPLSAQLRIGLRKTVEDLCAGKSRWVEMDDELFAGTDMPLPCD